MSKHITPTVYLLHFARKLGDPDSPRGCAQHYIGFAEHDLAARLERHHAGNGSKLMAAVTRAGIPWVCVRVWEGGTRELERTLKAHKRASDYCPYCRGEQPPPCERMPGRRAKAIERPMFR